MKPFKLLFLCGVYFFSIPIILSAQSANTALSNLRPTKINKSLLPDSSGALNLGSQAKNWRNGYFSNAIGIGASASYPINILNSKYEYGIVVQNAGGTNTNGGLISLSNQIGGVGYGILAYGGYRGVYAEGDADSSNGLVIGVEASANGSLINGLGVHYGIYGQATNGTTNAAGYFNGDVYAANYYSTSDRKLKKNINSLQNPLQQLMQLKPSVFQFNVADYPQMNLPSNTQVGLIADEVKNVFPQLVKQFVQPAVYNKDRSQMLHPEVTFESVNYLGLIPVLIASVQQQQKTIEDLTTSFNNVKQLLAAKDVQQNLSSGVSLMNSSTLEQNTPNPFSQNTVIRCNVSSFAKQAQLLIYNTNGNLIKTYTLNKGANEVNINAGSLIPGQYTYTLLADGKIADSKKMMLTK